MKTPRIHQSRKGSLMVEAMVGVSVFLIGILGILNLVAQSMSINQLILSQFTAAHLAGEGIELIKNVVDGQVAEGNEWSGAQLAVGNGTWEVSLDTQSGTIILNPLGDPVAAGEPFSPLSNKTFSIDDSIPEYTYDASNSANLPTTFRRTVSVAWDDPDPAVSTMVTVRSRVDWTIKGSPYSIEVDDRFYKWRALIPLIP